VAGTSVQDNPAHARATAPSATIRARGEIAVWEWGAGPPVLMLHGFPDHPIGLETTARALADTGLRCICPGLPGYWPSAAVPDGDYGSPAVARDLLAVLDALDLERVALVGHDWGAELGYPLVAASPERFSAFIALGTPHPAGYAIRRSNFVELRSAWYAIFLAFAPGAAEIARQPSWLTALMHSWSPGLHRGDWPLVLEHLRRPGVMEAICSYYRANLEAPLSMPTISVPTTIIHGGQDGCISPLAYGDLDAFFSAGLVRHFLPEIGHWPHLEARELVLDQILDALTPAGLPTPRSRPSRARRSAR
jgi:pimeloyl-ACP methyl ester carboxylesterase